MCKVYTDASGIKWLYHVCPPAKARNYLHVQADKPWYNYYPIFYSVEPLRLNFGHLDAMFYSVSTMYLSFIISCIQFYEVIAHIL